MKRALEKVIKNPYVKIDLDALLRDYMTSLDDHFKSLLTDVSMLIPVAENVMKQGMRIGNVLRKEHDHLDKDYNYSSLFEKLFVNRGWKGEKLRRELELTDVSLKAISKLVGGLKETRGRLVSYRENIKNFKVSYLPWHWRGVDAILVWPQ